MKKYIILIALFQILNYYGISALIDGIYVTQVDHFTPQDYRKVEFVSYCYFIKYIIIYHFTNNKLFMK